jgi:hypothetical protein
MPGDARGIICDVSPSIEGLIEITKSFIGIGGLLTKIRTRDLSNTKQDFCTINHDFQ